MLWTISTELLLEQRKMGTNTSRSPSWPLSSQSWQIYCSRDMRTTGIPKIPTGAVDFDVFVWTPRALTRRSRRVWNERALCYLGSCWPQKSLSGSILELFLFALEKTGVLGLKLWTRKCITWRSHSRATPPSNGQGLWMMRSFRPAALLQTPGHRCGLSLPARRCNHFLQLPDLFPRPPCTQWWSTTPTAHHPESRTPKGTDRTPPLLPATHRPHTPSRTHCHRPPVLSTQWQRPLRPDLHSAPEAHPYLSVLTETLAKQAKVTFQALLTSARWRTPVHGRSSPLPLRATLTWRDLARLVSTRIPCHLAMIGICQLPIFMTFQQWRSNSILPCLGC